MVATARTSRQHPDAARPFIAADVGGTHVRVGLVRSGGHAGQPVSVLAYRKYVGAEYAGLAEVIEDFVDGLGGVPLDEGAIACAGYPLGDGSIISVNLPWPVSPRAIRDRLGFRELRLVNDFEAVAHAAGQVDASEVMHLSGPPDAREGPTLVVGPGTGFGAAVRIPALPRPVVLATEAGQAALTTTTELETAVLRELQREHHHVAVEHALSGPGLMRIHDAMRRLRGQGIAYGSPGEITAAALAGADTGATESLSVFCGLLGGTVGDMALLYGVRGGIYLAGGILAQIRGFLPASGFVERFLDKGPMRGALQGIPVKLLEHGQLGVVGAASWYLDLRAGTQS